MECCARDEWRRKEMVHQKKWAFNLSLKFCRVSDDRMVAGSLFHDAGPATVNARPPKLVFERGTWRSPCAAEWSRERAVSWAFDRQSSPRYSGVVPWTEHLYNMSTISSGRRHGSHIYRTICVKRLKSFKESSNGPYIRLSLTLCMDR